MTRKKQTGLMVTVYGVVALTFMMLTYLFESRGPLFILAFAAGYGLATIRHGSSIQSMDAGSQTRVTDLAMGKYGHLSHRP